MRAFWVLACATTCVVACVPAPSTHLVAVPAVTTSNPPGGATTTSSSERELRDGGFARSGWIYVSMIRGDEGAAIEAARRAGSERGAEVVRVESSGARTFGGGQQVVSYSGHMTSTASGEQTIVIVSLWRRDPAHAHDPPVFGSAWRDRLAASPSRDIRFARSKDRDALAADCDQGDLSSCLQLAWPDYIGPPGPPRDRATALYIEACALGVRDACVPIANRR